MSKKRSKARVVHRGSRRGGSGAAVAIALIAGVTIMITALLALYAIAITALAIVARTLIKTAGEVRMAPRPALPGPANAPPPPSMTAPPLAPAPDRCPPGGAP